jgi:alkanesulfonate monooxygenase SsuD/methylene tetrahydromethanopterin reductase-like flavin-dependent oxidoreductase (luciferase family)
MRLSTVILPIHPWHTTGRRTWQRAEELGLHAAYTYDHLSWRTFRDGPWFGAVPTLTAAAAATTTLRLGTMVTSPNFRHPVTLAKELMTLDDISAGRTTIGIGAGGIGFDATVLGQQPWSARERADRFAEFTALLARLLGNERTTDQGEFYSADEARMIPGCVQRPRLPLTVAATGPRGMRLAVRHGQGWVTTGNGPHGRHGQEVVAEQLARLATACEQGGRDPHSLDRVLLSGFTEEPLLDSLDAFVDAAGRYREQGIDEIVLHWPVPDSQFEADPAVFEKIVTEAPSQLG